MRIISWFITLFLLLLALGFTVKNNGDVTLSFWPSSVAFTLPTAIWVFGFLFTGFVLGSILTWLGMLRYRVEAHSLRKELAKLHKESEMNATQSRAITDNAVPAPLFTKRKIPWFGP